MKNAKFISLQSPNNSAYEFNSSTRDHLIDDIDQFKSKYQDINQDIYQKINIQLSSKESNRPNIEENGMNLKNEKSLFDLKKSNNIVTLQEIGNPINYDDTHINKQKISQNQNHKEILELNTNDISTTPQDLSNQNHFFTSTAYNTKRQPPIHTTTLHNSFNSPMAKNNEYCGSSGNNTLENSMNFSSNYAQSNNSKSSSSRAFAYAMKALQEKIKILEENLRIVNNEKQSFKDAARIELEQTKQKYQLDIANYKNSENLLKDKMNLIEKQTTDMNNFIEKLEKDKEEAIRKYKEIENCKKAYEQQIIILQNEKSNLQKDLQITQTKLEDSIKLNQEIKKNEKDLQVNMTKELSILKHEKEELEKLNTKANEKIQKLETEQEEYKTIYNDHLNELVLKNESLTNEIDSIKNFYNEQIKEFQKELNCIEQDNIQKLSEMEKFTETIKGKNVELNELLELKIKEADTLKLRLNEYIKKAQTLSNEQSKSPKISNNKNFFFPSSISPPYGLNLQLVTNKSSFSPKNQQNYSKILQSHQSMCDAQASIDPLYEDNNAPLINLNKIDQISNINNISKAPQSNQFEKRALSLPKPPLGGLNVGKIDQLTPKPKNGLTGDKGFFNQKSEELSNHPTSQKNMVINLINSKVDKVQTTPIHNIKDINYEIDQYLYSNSKDMNNSPKLNEISELKQNTRKNSGQGNINSTQMNNNNGNTILRPKDMTLNQQQQLINNDEKLYSSLQNKYNTNPNFNSDDLMIDPLNGCNNPIDQSIRNDNINAITKGINQRNILNMTKNNDINNNSKEIINDKRLSSSIIKKKGIVLDDQITASINFNDNVNNIDLMNDIHDNYNSRISNHRDNNNNNNNDQNIMHKIAISDTMQENQEYLSILEKIQKTQDNINKQNQNYQELAAKSQKTQDSKEKAYIRSELMNITDNLRQLGEQLFSLKKKQQIMTQNNDFNNLL